MAAWSNSSASAAAASGPGPGAGRRLAGGRNRWQERGRGRATQPQYRYRPRPVSSNPNANAPPPPSLSHSMDQQQQSSASTSTSTRPRLPLADDKPPPSVPVSVDASRNAANFECNVCFDMAADPVVTSCGHLFCWDCLYQWLHVHSQHRECPVCKGQVAHDAIIPIYGRGGSAPCLDTAPPRPTGARVDSCRQQQPPHLDLEDDDEESDPFDLHWFPLGYGAASPTWSPGLHLDYDDYTNIYNYDGFDDYDLLGFPVFAASQGQGHGHDIGDDIMDALFSSSASGIGAHHQPHYQSRGRRQRQRDRSRAIAAAHHSSADGIDAASNVHTADSSGSHGGWGDSSGPHGGWAERRGRSYQNLNWNPSNSTGTVRGGMQNSRRQRRNSNR